MKICQISHVIFQTTSQVFLQILHHSSVSRKITPLYCFSSNIIYFGHKEPVKTNILDFGLLGSKFVKFLMSILKQQVNSLSIFVSFFIAMTHNSSVNFNFILFLFCFKRSHQNPNFGTFKCSGENLPYSPCHFPNYKSIFLQILPHSSVL